jgi:LDH2 family malate/lactate/ureidoglycolate dehydrogenase
MNRYNPERVKEQVVDIAKAVGVAEEDARILADSLVDADLHGVSTHGVSRVNVYVRRIQKGLIDPKAELQIDRQSPGVLAVNAGNGLGQIQACKALDRLTPLAKQSGISAATIRNSQHFGALSYYCRKAAEQDMILLAMTNAEPAMSPSGGAQAYFGTNPLAASFPTGKGYPVRVDLATSVVARGHIIAAQKRGETIPEGWALDEEGTPTTNAEKALVGTVLTMAGHKGYALALLVEVFSGVLSGAAMGAGVGSMYKNRNRKQDVGHFFCLFDIEAFMPASRFRERMDRVIDELKACKRRPGVKEIMIPGEPEHRKALENRRDGIPIGQETVEELQALCEELQVAFVL